ncbi:hypothetical protein QUC31_011900 [Theobroma cacao]
MRTVVWQCLEDYSTGRTWDSGRLIGFVLACLSYFLQAFRMVSTTIVNVVRWVIHLFEPSYSPGFWLIGRESHGAEGASVGFGWEQCSETNLAKIMWEQLESTDHRIGTLTEIDHT